MDLTIVMLNGTSHSLRVNPGDTVGSLKQRIQDTLGVSCETQKLVFENGQKVQLSDDLKLLRQYGLYNGAKVFLLLQTPPTIKVQTPPTIQVFLRNEKGATSTYDIKPDETVSHFKTRVQSREGVPVSQQTLSYNSRVMTEGKLSDYGVQNNGTIYLSLGLRGG